MTRVLVLCTGNSARSILGEALFNELGEGRITAVSAGSHPTGAPNPYALAELTRRGIDTGFAASKSWDAFAGPDAPVIDYVITVCDSAAAETCPLWTGPAVKAHWGLPDPAGIQGTEDEIATAFRTTADRLEARIRAFLALPFDSAEPASLRDQIAAISDID